jgi:hypothetical protein
LPWYAGLSCALSCDSARGQRNYCAAIQTIIFKF